MQSQQWVKFALLAIAGFLGGNNIAYAQAVDAGKYTGGGLIDSRAGGAQKATFGFNLEGVDGDGDGFVDRVDDFFLKEIFPGGPVVPFLVYWHVGRGQFQYNDHGAGVKFHLDLDAAYELNPDDSIPDRVVFRTTVIFPPFPPIILVNAIEWNGTYSSEDGSGKVFVSVNAEEDAFGSLVDTIRIWVQSGPYSGYSNFGELKGGNIQWHPAGE
jgi:hypothetical protein